MKLHSVELEFMTLEVPEHWNKTNPTREQDERSLHLVKNTSFYDGSIHISERRYRPSQAPRASGKYLSQNLILYTQDQVKRWIGIMRKNAYDQSLLSDGERVKMAAASFEAFDDTYEIGVFLRGWHISDGRHFVYVVYRSDQWRESRQARQQELSECESIISRIKFKK